jgi:hypothetical protein
MNGTRKIVTIANDFIGLPGFIPRCSLPQYYKYKI